VQSIGFLGLSMNSIVVVKMFIFDIGVWCTPHSTAEKMIFVGNKKPIGGHRHVIDAAWPQKKLIETLTQGTK
jgi:hypothetical protein